MFQNKNRMMAAAMILLSLGGRNAAAMEVWAIDPLEKVFRDAAPVPDTRAEDHVARGEYGVFQLVLKSETPLDQVSVTVSEFSHNAGGGVLGGANARWVGYVNVDRPTQSPSRDQLRVPPADYPDVLLEETAISMASGHAQPAWITVPVPLGVAEGIYRGTAIVRAVTAGIAEEKSFPLKLVVYPISLDRTRLWVTNWFAMRWPHMNIAPEPESEEYYGLLRRYARNMADHNQNVALISPLGLAGFSVNASGGLDVNFEKFDRWVRIFMEEGVIGRIEGGHIGGRVGGWESDFCVSVRTIRNGTIESGQAAPDSEEAKSFYRFFFPALVSHLKENGWLDIYMQHLADEPISSNLESYRGLAALAREYAPELPIMEANHSKELAGAMDIWVPQLNFLHRDFAHYQERQAAGDEVWFYTCVFPQGEYANRFIEQPLIKTRLLHWINFTSGTTGYLHWGYNQWTDEDPRIHTTRAHGGPPYLPAGDPWIVYPGSNGPLDSIRFEAMRDGAFDHELLCRLAEANPEKARELAARHILDFDKYETDLGMFRATRIELLQAVAVLPDR